MNHHNTMTMKNTVILDNGHGGVIGGIYQTAGKRSPNLHHGVLWEGMFNRWVVNRLIEKLDRDSIPYYHASPEYTDTTLGTRVSRANKIYEKDKGAWFLSIHANAGGGEGIEGFTSVGATRSDIFGEIILRDLKECGINIMRTDPRDGDMDKETNFYVLANTRCPSFLLECGFMDGVRDYNNLWDSHYLDNLVTTLFRSIVKIYNNELWLE